MATNTTPAVFDLEVNLSSLNNSSLNAITTTVNRLQAIVQNPSDYYVSVSRFICNTQQIPLWDPVINITSPNNDGYNTIYSVYLTYGLYASQQVYLRVINTNSTYTAPQTPTTQPTNAWGYVYSYNIIAQMINTALATAYTQLLAAVAGSLPMDANPPYVSWNPTTQLFTMNGFPMSQYDQSTGDDVVEIYFNNSFRQYLLGWDIVGLTNTGNANGKDCLLVLRNNGINYSPQNSPPTFLPTDPTTTTLQYSQNCQTFFAYATLAKLQIIASLPIAFPTQAALPLDQVGTVGNDLQIPMLCDFVVNYSNSTSSGFCQPISYFPALDSYSSPIQLCGGTQLNSFTIGITWTNIEGQSFPLEAFGTVVASIKLTFTHKALIQGGII
ncbi:MAG: putative minor capsid protein [Yellowstone Lake virophage 7]|uniref:putative minor capsid protein n=1 Tax=Yellowstone Lake virophage 7 TaxID=1557035 RepID=UPI0005360D6D|nr:MAG: putative minor capsid protein [Yellowstone Lake virophage 7]AIW01945.1 MAG: putative minor capsid protein [Yellowstone Lake virophage 7]